MSQLLQDVLCLYSRCVILSVVFPLYKPETVIEVTFLTDSIYKKEFGNTDGYGSVTASIEFDPNTLKIRKIGNTEVFVNMKLNFNVKLPFSYVDNKTKETMRILKNSLTIAVSHELTHAY